MATFPTWIPDCDSHSPGLLDLFLSSDASISSTMAFPPLANSDHVVFSVSIRVSIIFRTGCPISSHCLWLFWCYCDGLCDHLRDVLWKDIFKVSTSAAASEFCEWFQVGIEVYIPHRKY